jgi:hypothetical protein
LNKIHSKFIIKSFGTIALINKNKLILFKNTIINIHSFFNL